MNDAERNWWRAERRRRWAEVRVVLYVVAIAAAAIWWLTVGIRG